MKYSDLAVVEEVLAPEQPRLGDPSLLVEARIKAEKLRDFVEEINEDSPEDFVSLALIQDYNGLRALVAGASPRLIAILPPELPIRHPGAASGFGTVEVSYRQFLFFCDQIKDLLKHQAVNGHKRVDPVPRIDDNVSLFGPGGLRHDAKLLAVARIKAQSLVDFVREEFEEGFRSTPPSAILIQDYNRLRQTAFEAAGELVTIVPPEIRIPVEPKPGMEELPPPTNRSWFFGSRRKTLRPKDGTSAELYYYSLLLARLLK